jgi:hypothetical protein
MTTSTVNNRRAHPQDTIHILAGSDGVNESQG